jgi:hypothetical protein
MVWPKAGRGAVRPVSIHCASTSPGYPRVVRGDRAYLGDGLALVRVCGLNLECLVGFAQRQQFEQRVEREFQQWQRQQQQ